MSNRRTTVVSEGGGPAGVHAILVDPEDLTIVRAWLPTLPGAAGYGPHIEPQWLVNVLGTKRVAQLDLVPGEVLLAAAPESRGAWRYGEGGPVHGCAVIVGYDKAADSYSDTRLTLQMVSELVAFAASDDDEADEEEAA